MRRGRDCLVTSTVRCHTCMYLYLYGELDVDRRCFRSGVFNIRISLHTIHVLRKGIAPYSEFRHGRTGTYVHPHSCTHKAH